MKKLKTIGIERSKRLEDSIKFFSSPAGNFLKLIQGEGFELLNEDGTKHERSDELNLHLKNLVEAKKIINEILKQ